MPVTVWNQRPIGSGRPGPITKHLRDAYQRRVAEAAAALKENELHGGIVPRAIQEIRFGTDGWRAIMADALTLANVAKYAVPSSGRCSGPAKPHKV